MGKLERQHTLFEAYIHLCRKELNDIRHSSCAMVMAGSLYNAIDRSAIQRFLVVGSSWHVEDYLSWLIF